MRLDFWNNPLVVSAFRVKYRRGGLYNTTTLYLLALLGGGMVLFYYNDRFGGSPFPRNYLAGLLGVQLALSLLIAAAATSTSLRTEVVNRTLDFQRIASIGPRELLLGKMIGEPALAYLWAIAVMPLIFFCYLLGVENFSFPVLLLWLCNFLSTTALAASLGLVQRLEPPANKATGGGGGGGASGLIIGFVFVPQILIHAKSLLNLPAASAAVGLTTPVPAFIGTVQGDPWEYRLGLFGLQIPFLLVTPLSQLLLASLCLQIMTRRLVNPLNPTLSKPTAYLTLGLFDVLAAGVLFGPIPPGLNLLPRCAVFCLAHFAAAVFFASAVTPTREGMESWVWRLRGRLPYLKDLFWGERSVNTLVLLAFGLMGMAAELLLVALPATADVGGAELQASFPAVVAIGLFTAFLLVSLGALLQCIVLIAGRNGRALFVTAVILLMLPPHALGQYYDLDFLRSLAPGAHLRNVLVDAPPLPLVPVVVLYTLVLVVSLVGSHRRVRRTIVIVEKKLAGMGVQKPAD